jgi:hypothetical protein
MALDPFLSEYADFWPVCMEMALLCWSDRDLDERTCDDCAECLVKAEQTLSNLTSIVRYPSSSRAIRKSNFPIDQIPIPIGSARNADRPTYDFRRGARRSSTLETPFRRVQTRIAATETKKVHFRKTAF